MSYSQANSLRVLSVALVALTVTMAAPFSAFAADKKPAPLPPAHAQSPVPAVTNEYVHKEFGDNCSLLPGVGQFVGDLDGDGINDLVLAARCKNPMADQGEYGFRVSDPFDSDFGYGNVKVTSGFISEDPDRKDIVLLIVHGVGPQAWRSDKEKPKFLLINLPFTAVTVKRLALRKRTILGVYMEGEAEGEQVSSVIFWDGKKYRYQSLGSAME
ncbi:MAG: hypothetical protein WA252_15485 [Candidatus Sulfotelmatobacter sp.]